MPASDAESAKHGGRRMVRTLDALLGSAAVDDGDVGRRVALRGARLSPGESADDLHALFQVKRRVRSALDPNLIAGVGSRTGVAERAGVGPTQAVTRPRGGDFGVARRRLGRSNDNETHTQHEIHRASYKHVKHSSTFLPGFVPLCLRGYLSTAYTAHNDHGRSPVCRTMSRPDSA